MEPDRVPEVAVGIFESFGAKADAVPGEDALVGGAVPRVEM